MLDCRADAREEERDQDGPEAGREAEREEGTACYERAEREQVALDIIERWRWLAERVISDR